MMVIGATYLNCVGFRQIFEYHGGLWKKLKYPDRSRVGFDFVLPRPRYPLQIGFAYYHYI